jgi:NAD(P) transhydrogenase subunit alpha
MRRFVIILLALAALTLAFAPGSALAEGPVLAPAPAAAAEAPAPTSMAVLVTIFVLAIYLGVELINKVPPTLHTPLMSGSNAISGITVIGALTCAYKAHDPLIANIMGAVAVCTAMINVVGGFLVTDRMLAMFGEKKPAAPAPAAGAK